MSRFIACLVCTLVVAIPATSATITAIASCNLGTQSSTGPGSCSLGGSPGFDVIGGVTVTIGGSASYSANLVEIMASSLMYVTPSYNFCCCIAQRVSYGPR